MNRGDIVSEAWSIMRSNRSLWGITALVLIADFIISLALGLVRLPFLAAIRVPVGAPLAIFLSGILSIIESAIGLLLTAFLSGALISMVNDIADNRPINVSAGLKAGRRWMIPLFIIDLVLAVPAWVISALLSGSVMAAFTLENDLAVNQILQSAGVLGLSVVFILVVSILCNAIGIGAERAVVLQNRRLIEALKYGWRLLWTHLGDYVVIGLLLLGIGLGIGIIFGCGLIVTGFIFGTTPNSLTGPLTLSALIAALLGIVVSIVLTVLQSAAWTLAFREWQMQEHSDLPVVSNPI